MWPSPLDAYADSYMPSVRAAMNWARQQGWLESLRNLAIAQAEEGEDMKGEELDRMLQKVPVVVGKGAAASWRLLPFQVCGWLS